jgi:hypothetical protein
MNMKRRIIGCLVNEKNDLEEICRGQMVIISQHLSGGTDKPRVYTRIRNKSFVTICLEHCRQVRLLADEVLLHPASYANLGEGNSLLRAFRKSERVSHKLLTRIVLSLSGTDPATPRTVCSSCWPWTAAEGSVTCLPRSKRGVKCHKTKDSVTLPRIGEI